MTYTEHRCPSCGAPLAPPSAVRSIRCAYCATLLAPSKDGWRAAAPPAADEPLDEPHLPRAWLGGHRYAIRGALARGETCDVHWARRDARITELVVLKIARGGERREALAREARVLGDLAERRAQGVDHFGRLGPQLVAHGPARRGMRGDEGDETALATRWRSGFVHTLADVRAAYPSGVPAEHGVWIWKRVLEVLNWVHAAGWVHGAVTPRHLLVHARDHGVVLAGWSRARHRVPATPVETPSADEHLFYPASVRAGAPAGPAVDVAMSARAVAYALGAAPETGSLPASVPESIAALVRANLEPETATEDAWALRDRLDAAARAALGPPRYHHFQMPGWPTA